MKRIWHSLFTEPFTWMFYAFFQPRRLNRELAVSGFRQRLMIMLRMVIPMVLVTYPVAVLGQILLIPFHLLSHPDIASILLSSAGGIAGGIAFGSTFIVCYLLGLFRLPFYPVSGPSALKAYLKSRGDPTHVFDYLHCCSLYWDEIVYLPLPYLKQTLLIASAQDAEKALEEIAFIAAERPQQLRAARGAALEMAIGYLEQCKTMQEIAEAAHYLDTIFPQETKLLDPQWSAPITRMRDASRDAQRFSSPIGRVARMEALDDMVKQLKSVHPNVAFRDARLNARLSKVIDVWIALARQEQEELKRVPVYIGSIDNPYNPGYPLKPEDPLFQGR